jgi:antitoxin VapB
MKIAHTRTFKSGNSEAVRLPKSFAFGEGVEVEIVKNGDELIIRRKHSYSGRDLIDALQALPKPSRTQKRERIEFPERPGL